MVAFSIFWYQIYRYWILYIISFLIIYFLLDFIIYKIKDSINKEVFEIFTKYKDDLFIYIILWVILWWRLGHMLFYDTKHFLNNPLSFFEFHKWWMAFFGWIIWVSIALIIFSKKKWIFRSKNAGSDIFQILDISASIAWIWSLIWRRWNFLNQELYWVDYKATFLKNLSQNNIIFLQKIWILHIYDKIDNLLRINTNLLSSLWEWLLTLIISQIIFWKIYWKNSKSKLKWKYWLVALIWLITYSFIRFFIEFRKETYNKQLIGPLTISQYLFIFISLFSIISYFIISKKK